LDRVPQTANSNNINGATSLPKQSTEGVAISGWAKSITTPRALST